MQLRTLGASGLEVSALGLRDQSIVTATVLMTKRIFDSTLRHYIANAKINGVTAEEMAEIITHATFCAGWPNAWAVFAVVQEIYGEVSTDQQGE